MKTTDFSNLTANARILWEGYNTEEKALCYCMESDPYYIKKKEEIERILNTMAICEKIIIALIPLTPLLLLINKHFAAIINYFQ